MLNWTASLPSGFAAVWQISLPRRFPNHISAVSENWITFVLLSRERERDSFDEQNHTEDWIFVFFPLKQNRKINVKIFIWELWSGCLEYWRQAGRVCVHWFRKSSEQICFPSTYLVNILDFKKLNSCFISTAGRAPLKKQIWFQILPLLRRNHSFIGLQTISTVRDLIRRFHCVSRIQEVFRPSGPQCTTVPAKDVTIG